MRTAKSLVTVVQHFIVQDDLHAGCHGAHFEKCHHRIRAFVRQSLNEATRCEPRCIRFNVYDGRFEPGSFCQTLSVLHFFTPGCGNQHIDVAGGIFAGAHDAKVETYFIQRERDVLIGLGLDLHLQLLVSHAPWQGDFFGDDSRGWQRQGNVFSAGATFFDKPAQCIGDFVEFFDVSICNPTGLQRLDSAAFQDQTPRFIAPQFHQLDTGGTDVDTQQGRRLPTE